VNPEAPGQALSFPIRTDRHFDHTGNVLHFPNAKIVCGPGEAVGTPSLATETARVSSVAWDDMAQPIGSFSKSHDFLGDGSILLVPLFGHTPGHIGALVRSGQDEYVLLASDGCHHHLLLSHRPEDAHYALGKVLAEDAKEGDPPTVSANYEDYDEASRSLERIRVAGRREEIMVVLAHDEVGWKRWEEKEGTEGVELKGWKARGLKADMVEGME
jgi:glyoxylase-like metal-dependent hydrolase (beta-lactamase superfamily II)